MPRDSKATEISIFRIISSKEGPKNVVLFAELDDT